MLEHSNLLPINLILTTLLLLLFYLGLSGRAGPLPIKGNKLLGSLWYRSNPQGALLQAQCLGAGEVVGPALFGVGVHPPRRGAPDRCWQNC